MQINNNKPAFGCSQCKTGKFLINHFSDGRCMTKGIVSSYMDTVASKNCRTHNKKILELMSTTKESFKNSIARFKQWGF